MSERDRDFHIEKETKLIFVSRRAGRFELAQHVSLMLRDAPSGSDMDDVGDIARHEIRMRVTSVTSINSGYKKASKFANLVGY